MYCTVQYSTIQVRQKLLGSNLSSAYTQSFYPEEGQPAIWNLSSKYFVLYSRLTASLISNICSLLVSCSSKERELRCPTWSLQARLVVLCKMNLPASLPAHSRACAVGFCLHRRDQGKGDSIFCSISGVFFFNVCLFPIICLKLSLLAGQLNLNVLLHFAC